MPLLAIQQRLGRFCDELRALALAALEKQQALTEDEAIEQESLRLGFLGADQLAWLEKDLAGRPSSTPIVIFAHIPLWTIYPQWGWGTDDSAQALALLKRFGSVTVLNGHIHQIIQKVEGNMTFHTTRSTAFPQPAPGTAPSPGPMKVPEDKLRTVLGIADVTFKQGDQRLAIIDQPLAG